MLLLHRWFQTSNITSNKVYKLHLAASDHKSNRISL